jgi:cytochrome c
LGASYQRVSFFRRDGYVFARGSRFHAASTNGVHMTRRVTLAIALAICVLSSRVAEAGDPAAGKAIFQRICENCHSGKIGINKVGPSLWNVVGRQAAAVPGYDYSDGMRANKTPWSASSLDMYLADPRGDVHGAKMYFKGLSKPKDRADVIAFLQTLK